MPFEIKNAYLLGILLLLFGLPAWAQVTGVPLEQIPQQARRHEQVRLQNAYRKVLGQGGSPAPAALLLRGLPFFDDFSKTEIAPSDSLWYSFDGQYGVYVNNVYGDYPPSKGVATFDGISAVGLPYSTNTTAVGRADTLTSQGFSLQNQNQNGLRLSFFVMPGNREVETRPDTADSLVVQFLQPDGVYRSVAKYKGGVEPQYHFRSIPVTPEFFFDGFRFKFVSYGRLNGAYDVWNLDYVRLDYRAEADSFARDIAMSSQPGPVFGKYRSVPLDHLKNGSLEFGDSTTSAITNLNPAIINFNLVFRAQEYLNSIAGREFLFVPTGGENIEGTATPLFPGETRRVHVIKTAPGRQYSLPVNAVTGDYQANFTLTGVDPTFNTVTSNDTVQAFGALRDYYAYDDSTHEKAFLLSGNSARLLYRFETIPGIPDTQRRITGLTFGIDSRTFRFNTGVPFNVIIYSKVKGVDNADNDEILYFNAGYLIGFSSEATNLKFFATTREVQVPSPFYVGFQQGLGVENTVYIQADINTVQDTNTFFFSTTPGNWDRYTLSRNALIIRPHFKCPSCPLAVRPRQATLDFDLYPNPSLPAGRMRIQGQVQTAQLLSPDGRVLAEYTAPRGESLREITLPAGLAPGLYLMKGVGKEGAFGSRRITITNE